MDNLSKKLSALMKEKNIKSTLQLFKKLEEANLSIPYMTLKRILEGNAEDIMKLNHVRKFCNYFDVTMDYLVNDNEQEDLESIRYASFNGLDVDGLDENDLRELEELIKIKKLLKQNKKE